MKLAYNDIRTILIFRESSKLFTEIIKIYFRGNHMQAKLRILTTSITVAAAVSAPVSWAEDIHQVGGRVQVSVDVSSENGPGGTQKGTNIKSNASRIGVAGKMDTTLDNTKLIYKAVVQYEATGENDQTIKLRDGFVGLSNKKAGKVRLGRLTGGYKSSYTKIEPWTDHVLQARQGGQQGASNLNANYFNNAIDYHTPSFGGLVANVMYSKLPDNSTSRLHNAGKLKGFTGGEASAIGVKYKKGGLRLTADFLNIDSDAQTGGVTNGDAVKASAQYKMKSSGTTIAGQYEDVTDLMLGTNIWVNVAQKIGENGLVTVSVGTNEGDPSDNVYTSATKGDAITYSVGGKYMLTKKSALIIGYNVFDRDGVAETTDTFTVGINSRFGGI